jgi:hypothetical protein
MNVLPEVLAGDPAMVLDGDTQVSHIGGDEVDEDVGKEDGVDGQAEPAGPVRMAARPDEDQAEGDLQYIYIYIYIYRYIEKGREREKER